MEFKDYYSTLGVSKSASEKEINEAYEVLGDPEKRRKYDELGANWRQYEQAQQQGQGWPGGAAGGFGGFGSGDPGGGAWTINMGGPGGYRTMTEDEMHEMFGNEDPFSDFFRTFFGGGRGAATEPRGRAGRQSARTQRGRDLEQEVDLTLEEAYHGAMRRIMIDYGGQTRTVDVRIPAGVKAGTRVRAAGEGEPGSNGGPAGDLFLRVGLRPHPVFERRGDDLHAKVAVPVTTAVLGGEAQIPTITGSVRLKVPETTQSGQVFRLKGHGMPIVGKPDTHGDLYATIDVQLPRSLTKDQRQHYEALRKAESGARS